MGIGELTQLECLIDVLKNNNVKGINISCDNLVDTIVKTIYLNTEYKQDEIKESMGN